VSAPLQIFTVGHSNHSIEAFVALLRAAGVQMLVDVRSQPYSRYSPHFNRAALSAALTAADIRYQFMGDSLGGRPQQADLYDPGEERPNYARQRATPLYQEGVRQLLEVAAHQPTAIMCSEGDPAHCHRSLLIGPSFFASSVIVLDIYPDGQVKVAEPPVEQLGFGF
jgi:uncharacterized protein (DUF488 family)